MKEASVPRHIAIIMDGNGRWAKKKGLPKIAGHRAGVQAAERILEAARECGVKILTLYTFSTENWERPKHEVRALFALLERYLDTEIERLHRNQVRFNTIGEIETLPESLQKKIAAAIAKTASNDRLNLNLALNYGGRREIVQAARRIAQDVAGGRLAVTDISDTLFADYLYTKGIPDPDLLIRTSGEMRISNFLLWQISYAEIYITKTLWPDFDGSDLKAAIGEFQKRERRYGA